MTCGLSTHKDKVQIHSRSSASGDAVWQVAGRHFVITLAAAIKSQDAVTLRLPTLALRWPAALTAGAVIDVLLGKPGLAG